MLQHISSSEEPSAAAGTLGLLIHHALFQQGLLQAAMTALGSIAQGSAAAGGKCLQKSLCRQQVVMLQLLADELEGPASSRYC